MRPISPIDRILRSLRSKAVGRRARAQEAALLADTHAASTAKEPSPDPSPALQTARQIEAISKEDAERRPRIFRAFLEARLLEHIDAPALADPTFQALLDKVHHTLFNDPALEVTVKRVVDLLSRTADDGSLAQELQAALDTDPDANAALKPAAKEDGAP